MIFVFMGITLLAACSEGKRLTCSDRPKACVSVTGQTHVPATGDSPAKFVIRVASDCPEAVDIKLCFEDTRGGADCREHTAVPRGREIAEEKEERFAGPGIKLFSRFSKEARYCTFPLTDRVTF